MTMARVSCVLGFAVCALTVVAAQPAATHHCVVVDEGAGPRRLAGTAAECASRLSPASTYKIPHALIGLETGVITETTVAKWDGVPHPQQPRWNQDHTVLSAMKPSVVWFFQWMAPKIGAARAHEWLQRFAYGNTDTGGDVQQYWLNGRLRISPDEQLAFVRKFYAGALPVSREHSDRLQSAIEQEPGTVENARGVHTLAVRWRPGMLLNSKTGATTIESGESVSWLVGRLTVDGRTIVFASAVWRNGEVDSLDAARLAFTTMTSEKIIDGR